MLQRIGSSKKYIFINIMISMAEFLVDSFATLYLLEKGVSYTQIGIMWTLYLGVTALTDYPTGGFSDKFGRRRIYAIGILLTSASYFMILSKNIPMLYISYMIKGLGTSLISGSLISWLSCDLNDNDKFKDTIAKSNLITNICSFVLPIILFMNENVNMDFIFWIAAVIHLLIGIFSLVFLKENYGSQEKITFIYKDVMKYFFKNKVLLFITFINITLYLFFTIFYYVWQPITNSILANNRFLPLCYGVYTLFTGISAFLIKFLKKISIKKLTMFSMIIYCLSFVNFYIANNMENGICLFFAMMLFGLSGGCIFMLINIFINEYTSNEYKSSVISLISSICTVINVIFQFLFGKMIDILGMNILIICGIVLPVILLVGLVVIKGGANEK